MALNDDGGIRVDNRLESSVGGIFATCDATGGAMFSHTASSMAVFAAENALGTGRRFPFHLIPRCLWTQPGVGAVGLSEEDAEKQGYEIETRVFPFSINGLAGLVLNSARAWRNADAKRPGMHSHAKRGNEVANEWPTLEPSPGWAMVRNQVDGAVKIVFDDRYGEILGVHIVGSNATEIIGEAVTAMQLEATAQELARSIRVHPTFSEAVVDAAWDAGGWALYLPRS